MFSLAIFIFLLSSSIEINAETWRSTPTSEKETNVFESWIKLDKSLKDATKWLIKASMPMILESSSQLNLSSQCLKESLLLVSGLRKLNKWAFSFVDSSAKLPTGTLSGTMSYLGEYDQCVETIVPHPKVKDNVLFQGQYCTVDFRFTLPPKAKRYRLYDQLDNLQNLTGTEVITFFSTKAHLMYMLPIKLGLCIPSGCSQDDLNEILNFASQKLNIDAQATHCEVKKEKTSFLGIQVFTIVCICVLATVVLLGTLMEMFPDSRNASSKNLGCQILLSFSMISNFKRLMSTKTSSDKFSCLYGVRFLTITWVVSGHTYFYAGYFMNYYRTLFRVERISTEPVAQMIINGSEAVDTFFFMGGMLVCYLTVKYVKLEKKRFNYVLFILHRLLRIIPSYYFINLCVTLLPLMCSGPLFHDVMKLTVYPCFEYWWRNFFFINNFYGGRARCMVHMWYVSCDLQLYLSSVIVILPLIRSKKIGIVLNVLVVMASIVYSGMITYVYDLAPTITLTYLDPEEEGLFFLYTYANPLSRAGPYFIGVFTGYLLAVKPDIKIPKKIQIIGWLLATLSSGMVIFMVIVWYEAHQPLSIIEVSLYAAFYKVGFTAGVAWMVFCCITGHGGIINKFLSWKVWVPLGKLVFLTYLIEPVFQISFIANFRSTEEYSHLHFIIQFFGYLCISTLLALICNLLVESPFLGVEKLLFSSKHQTEENGSKNIEHVKNDVSMSMKAVTKDMALEMGQDNSGFSKTSFNI